MIKKIRGGYKVVSEKTGKSLGGTPEHPLSKAAAYKRLGQIEWFKAHKGSIHRS